MSIFRSLHCAALALVALLPVAVHADDTSIDTRFNPNGIDPGWRRAYDTVQPAANQLIIAAARAPDGGYVLAGRVPGGTGGALIFLAKVRPSGDYDVSFGGTIATGNAGVGRVLKDANLTSVSDMTIDAQGRIVVVGETPGALGQSDFAALRFNPNGTDDTSFAGDGSTYIGFDLDTAHGRASDTPTSVTAASDGSVYIAGKVEGVTVGGGSPTTRVGVAKLMPDGSNTNTGYGTLSYGRQLFNCSYGCENVQTVTRIVYDAPRNRLVIGGDYSLSANDTDWFLTTQVLGAAPSVQTTSYPIDFGGNSGFQKGFLYRLDVQRDGKIVALGFAYDANEDRIPVVLRVQSGIVNEDTSFGNVSGRGIMLPGTIDAVYYDLAFDSSGRILLVGYYFGYDVAIATRLMPNGTIDTGFNGDTVPTAFVATTSNGSSNARATFFGRVFLDAGRPVIAGMATDSATAVTDYDLIITRLQADRIFVNGLQ
ncbi:MAG: hypothetical protein ABI411_18720 [Tahibacter sp.]